MRHVTQLSPALTLAMILIMVVTAKDCDQGSLQCASVMGNNVQFCHWDRPRLFEQPEIVCNGCRRAAFGDVLGVACNALALRNWADSDPVWLQAPLFASRDLGLVGQVRYELRHDMFGKVTIVGTMEGADVTFQRLKRHEDPMFRSIQVAPCFEATIESQSKDGKPIHYTLTGPSKIVEIKEPNLWIGAVGFAHLTLRPVKCRLNRGIKEETARPTPPPSTQGQQVVETVQVQPTTHRYEQAPNGHHSTVPTTVDARQHDPVADDDDSVELVYPDGHVEIVPEHYVQQHFVTSDHHHHDHHYPQVVEPVVVHPMPVYDTGDTTAVQYHPAPVDHRVTQRTVRAETVIAPGSSSSDRVVLPPLPSTGSNTGPIGHGPAHGSPPVAVVPVIYYVTDPGHAGPGTGTSNGYLIDGGY